MRLAEEWVKEFWAYSAQTMNSLCGFSGISLFPDLPIPLGHWLKSGILMWDWLYSPIQSQNCYSREVNCVPLLDTMSSGRPKFLKTWSTNRVLVSMEVGSTFRGTRQQALEKRWATTKMTVWLCELVKSVMKSTAIWDQGYWEMGSGSSSPYDSCLDILNWEHMVHALT